MNKYKIIVADNSGFCMGVKNAFNKSIEISSNFSNPVLFGDIVHNKYAINLIKESGLIVNENIESILNDDSIENVIIRAHGIPKSIEEKLNNAGKRIFDLTCPIVKKVQLLTAKLSDSMQDIIIFGKPLHPEVIGIEGYCKTKFIIVSAPEDAENLKESLNSPVLISQTTMNSDVFAKISEILQKKYPDLTIHNTLCNNTLKTQISAVKLAETSDLMIVIGDKKSSNTISLYEKLKKFSKAVFVENPDDIEEKLIINKFRIGLTGGSSTPDYQIRLIKDKIENIIEALAKIKGT